MNPEVLRIIQGLQAGGTNSTHLLTGEDAKGWGLNTGTLGALGTGIQGLGGLASIYFGNKQLGLAEDQYETNKAFGNRNLANQAQTVNNSLEARYRAALAAKGQGTQGTQSESLQSYLDRSKVDGSAIG